MLRLLTSFVAALVILISLFWFMQWLITPKEDINRIKSDQVAFDFVKLKRESQAEQTRKRLPPKPEKQEAPEMKATSVSKTSSDVTPIAMNVAMPSLGTGGKFSAGKLSIPAMKGDSELIPLVRINPRYPRRAAQKGLEGHIKAKIFVGAKGQVQSIDIIESVPVGIFDSAAKKSLRKWKFKPKTVDGVGVEYSGTVTINFNLDKS